MILELVALDKNQFINLILDRDISILKIFYEGNKEEIILLCEKINSIEFDDYVKASKFYGQFFASSQIITFSTFNMVYDLVKMILFEKDEMGFYSIGKKLTGSNSKQACVKYGENHSKLAKELSLIHISKETCCKIQLTNFGGLIARESIINADRIFTILLLGNPMIQSMICSLLSGDINYKDFVTNLSKSTKIRRRTNIRFIINMITHYSNILDKYYINWEV